MTVKLELSCGITREVFDLHKVDWDLAVYSGVCRLYYNQTLFTLIIDSYQSLIKNELEKKHPDISLKYPGVDDKEIEEYGWDIHLYHEHMIKLWRWVALHPYCNVRTVEE